MFIHRFDNRAQVCRPGESMQVKLPRKGLKLDPRANFPHECRFDCHYHEDGITVTLTRIDSSSKIDEFPLTMRVIDPEAEVMPDFNSTTYVYLGVFHEKAPFDTTVVIIDPSVKTIKKRAFQFCTSMKRCIMHDEVETIEEYAFYNCFSLEALFLPLSLTFAGYRAFYGCKNTRILSLPIEIDINRIEADLFTDCHTFFRTTQIQPYQECGYGRSRIVNNNRAVIQTIIDFHRDLPPLHKECLNINVSAQSIYQCILDHGPHSAYNTSYGGMTPLHILALNPHASTGTILECFHANMSAVFVRYSDGYDEDNRLLGKSPLDCLLEYDLDSYVAIVAALCVHRDSSSGIIPLRKKRRIQ